MKTLCIIVPCYNESEGIPSLEGALCLLQRELEKKFTVEFLFVDDGSTDNTYSLLQGLRATLGHAIVLRHERNRNLGGALRTAVENLPPCDYICYLDSDCTYDPRIAHALVAKLEEGFDLVTASPYHPEGKVLGVPGWRLFLSKSLSAIYRFVTGAPLHTFTAMVRAQRSSCARATLSRRTDFTFVTEVLLNALSLNLRVTEIPAVLAARKFGASKMRVFRTVLCHLALVGEYLVGTSGKGGE